MVNSWKEDEDFGVGDIEDLLSNIDVDLEPRESRKTVKVRRRKRAPVEVVEKVEDKSAFAEELGSTVPGTESIYIRTWGCTHNTSDSEYMAGLLSSYGYTLTDDKSKADLWLLNSCTVKNPAEDHFRNEIEAGRKDGKKVVVAGCVPGGAPRSEYLRGLSVVGIHDIDNVVHVVEQTLQGRSVRAIGGAKRRGGAGPSLDLPKVRRNPLIEIIAISTGCLNQCTYCKTKHARGHLGSYPPDEIVARVKEAFSEGVCEIWLTSEDTGAYGRDINSSLPELLKKVVAEVPDGCRLRLGMTNPPYILDHLQEMSEILNDERVYRFLHVPVQSGSDAVLADMRREYCCADFEKLVDYLLERVDGLTVATDIICGFPTETENDFDETMVLLEKYKFPVLFTNQYYPRPGTPAAKMPRVPAQQVKTRTKRATELFASYEPYRGKEGSRLSVLCTDVAPDGVHIVGHDDCYHQVLVKGDRDLLGCRVEVLIESVSKFHMVGHVLSWRKVVNTVEKAPSSKEEIIIQNHQALSSQASAKTAISVIVALLLIRFMWIVFV